MEGGREILEKHSRVPTVTRIEYLIDLLEGLEHGEGTEALQKRLAGRKHDFEVEKYRALGRGNPFTKGLAEAKYLLTECVLMAVHADYVYSRTDLSLTSEGKELLSSPMGKRERLFTTRFLSIYPASVQTILALVGQPEHELILPDVRRSREADVFRSAALAYGIDAGIVSFLTIRDFLTQVGILNWVREKVQDDRPFWRIFLTSAVTEGRPSLESLATFTDHGKTFAISRKEAEKERFIPALMKEYMIMTRYVSLRPVFYSDLRSKVCSRLSLSDREFDAAIKRLIDDKRPLRILFSSGTLPYDRDSASLLKNLPPKTEKGDYLIYLKIERIEGDAN